MTIQLHRLEGFYWVSKHEGYAAAARNFPYSITQPAVHQQVKKLEADLGCRLFERASKDRLRHTNEGRRLFAFCAPFFEELPRVVRELESGSLGGEVRIDGESTAMRSLVPTWVRAIRHQNSDIAIRLTEVESLDLDRLRIGAADFAVGCFDDVPEGISLHDLGPAYSFVLVPDEHPLAGRKKPKPALLHDTPLISYPVASRAHRLQREVLEALSIRPRESLRAPTTESIFSMVASGLGFSVIPWTEKTGPQVAGVHAMRLKGLGVELPIQAAWRPGADESPALRAALALAPMATRKKRS